MDRQNALSLNCSLWNCGVPSDGHKLELGTRNLQKRLVHQKEGAHGVNGFIGPINTVIAAIRVCLISPREGIIMEPVTLVLTVCLLSAPEKCREERLELEIQDSLTQCMFRSVMYVSNWSGQHPGLSVRKWRCELPVASRDA